MKLDTWSIQGQAFHFGKHGIGQEESDVVFHSDSLFAALVSILAQTEHGRLIPEFMQKVLKSPPAFVLSSAFPRAGKVRFFPLPRWVITRDKTSLDNAGVTGKSLKKIQFVSEIIFKNIINGRSLALELQDSIQLQAGQLLCSSVEKSKLPAELKNSQLLWEVDQRPRVTLDRVHQSSNLFHTGAVYFSPHCGLWFAIKWNNPDEDLKKIMHNLIQLLADAGLGGERSSGFGHSKIIPTEVLELPEMADDSNWVTLSRYIPAADEIPALLDANSIYQLERIEGWSQSPTAPAERRQVVQMLSEGSVLGPISRMNPGEIVDVRPVYNNDTTFPHPIYRSGLALAIPIKHTGGLS